MYMANRHLGGASRHMPTRPRRVEYLYLAGLSASVEGRSMSLARPVREFQTRPRTIAGWCLGKSPDWPSVPVPTMNDPPGMSGPCQPQADLTTTKGPMFEPQHEPTCSRCGVAMVRRVRGIDGAPFWGCSTFPECRGTREMVTAAAIGHQPTASLGPPLGPDRERRLHFDRLVLALGAIGLIISLGFIAVGLTSGPNTFAFLGALLLALVAIVVLSSPLVSPNFARGYALKVAFLCVCLAVFFVAHDPVAKWAGQYFTDLITQSIPTHAPATPTAAPGGA